MVEWGTPGKASVLVGGQFGSEGKGLAAAWLAHQAQHQINIATTNAGAQAGHTTKYKDGHSFVCFHLPTTAVVRQTALAYINGGSIIDPVALRAELEACAVPIQRVRIHPRAAVITFADRDAERAAGSSTEKLASTQKGVGAALAGKVMRRGAVAEQALVGGNLGACIDVLDLNQRMLDGESVVVEVPQGTGLSINHGLSYPYCTSRDAWVGSGLSDAGIHPSFAGPVCMVVRTMPIRVGNLFNEQGDFLGNSGPFYHDSCELDWAHDLPGVEPERTTVTKRIRRIASWSDAQYAWGLSLNRPSVTALNFCNYLPNLRAFDLLAQKMHLIEEEVLGRVVQHVYGFGPCVEEMSSDYDEARAWYERRAF